MATLTGQLMQSPTAPAGWEIGFRQSAAYAFLPGDSCQLLERDDGRFCVALLDVAGHDTEAALRAVRLQNEIRLLWNEGYSLERIADVLNRSTIELSTLVTGVLVDVHDDGYCTYINAGHPPLVLFHEGIVEERYRTRPVFGVTNGGDESVGEFRVPPGAFLLVHSDGISEARSPDHEFIGENMVLKTLARHVLDGPQAVADALFDAAKAFAKQRLQDDATTIVLRRR